jgi:hypothetical protein
VGHCGHVVLRSEEPTTDTVEGTTADIVETETTGSDAT